LSAPARAKATAAALTLTATLRHWERGDRSPRGPALVLRNVIERKPEAVIEALA